ncbi:MAG TPA: 16S rRNA processing protein RimM, partial [Pseudomonas sp.]|nr:16S rRNA processing protein RimM [Pseudomonas sp.]
MNATSAPAEDLLVIGKIVSVHGVRGDVKVYSFTDPIDNLLDYRRWTLRRGDEVKQVELVKGRLQGKILVATLRGLTDREVARTYADFEICIPRSELPSLTGDEYYWYQLQGLRVINQLGQVLGRVDHLLETGANDVLVV